MHDTALSCERDRAKTQRETIVNRLPLQPPAKTPRPILVRPMRRTPPRNDVSGAPTGEALTGAPTALALFEPTPTPPRPPIHAVTPTALRQPTPSPAPRRQPTPAPVALLDDEPVPNLRASPRYGLVLALIGAAALAAGALTAMVVHRVEIDLPQLDGEADVEQPTPRHQAPVVISELPPSDVVEAPARARPAQRLERTAPARHPSRVAAPSAHREEGTRDAADAAEPGYLTVDAMPYATIFIDDQPIGDTPIVRHPLAPGTHELRAISAAGSQRLTVRIRSGQTLRRRLSAAR